MSTPIDVFETKNRIKKLGRELTRLKGKSDTGKDSPEAIVQQVELEDKIAAIQKERTELGRKLLEHDRTMEQKKLEDAVKLKTQAEEQMVDYSARLTAFVEKAEALITELGEEFSALKQAGQQPRTLANKAERLRGNRHASEMNFLSPEWLNTLMETLVSEGFDLRLRPMDSTPFEHRKGQLLKSLKQYSEQDVI